MSSPASSSSIYRRINILFLFFHYFRLPTRCIASLQRHSAATATTKNDKNNAEFFLRLCLPRTVLMAMNCTFIRPPHIMEKPIKFMIYLRVIWLAELRTALAPPTTIRTNWKHFRSSCVFSSQICSLHQFHWRLCTHDEQRLHCHLIKFHSIKR